MCVCLFLALIRYWLIINVARWTIDCLLQDDIRLPDPADITGAALPQI